MNLLMLGDIVPNNNVKVKPMFNSSIILFNLEAPIISSQNKPIKKAGPILGVNELILPFDSNNCKIIASLANNHIMDYGTDGLKNTLEACADNNIYTVGAGFNHFKSRCHTKIDFEGKIFGFLGVCEPQFGVSSFHKAGVAEIGAWIYDTIRKIKKEVDYLILSIHGASEMSHWPSPKWQELIRSYIDSGVDIVHGHHSHVPQGYEHYNNGIIFYGLGNFMVDPKDWIQFKNTLWSIVPEIELNESNEFGEISIKKSSISLNKNNSLSLVLTETENSVKYKSYICLCNTPLNDLFLLSGIWQENSVRLLYSAYAHSLELPEGKNEIKRINAKKLIIQLLMDFRDLIMGKKKNIVESSKQKLLLLYVLLNCDSHSHAISTALGVLSGELEDIRTKKVKIFFTKIENL